MPIPTIDNIYESLLDVVRRNMGMTEAEISQPFVPPEISHARDSMVYVRAARQREREFIQNELRPFQVKILNRIIESNVIPFPSGTGKTKNV